MSFLRYLEVEPCAALAGLVARISFSIDEARPYGPIRVLPDGGTDLLLSIPHGGGDARATVFGAKTTALVANNDAPLDQIAAHLRPGAAARILGVPARELRDRAVPLHELWGERARQLVERMQEARTGDDRRRILEHALIESGRARQATSETQSLVDRAVEAMHAHAGRVRIRALADDLGVGLRRLERAFLEHVGLRPKFLARVMRFRMAHAELRRGGEAARVALWSGYSDQSHMVREFRALAGSSPSQLRPGEALRK